MLRIQAGLEVWVVGSFLALGIGAVLVASLLSALGGPDLDLNTLIGATLLVAVTVVLSILTLWNRQSSGEANNQAQD